jgi:hypothetical protein
MTFIMRDTAVCHFSPLAHLPYYERLSLFGSYLMSAGSTTISRYLPEPVACFHREKQNE